MTDLFWIIVALLSGAMLPIQAALSTRLGQNVDNSIYASFITFAIGTLSLLVFILLSRQTASLGGLRQVHWTTWTGGVIGAAYVTAIIFLYPRLGPSMSFCLIVLGQLLLALLLEHFGWLDAEHHPISVLRLVGLALVIGGIYLMKRF